MKADARSIGKFKTIYVYLYKLSLFSECSGVGYSKKEVTGDVHVNMLVPLLTGYMQLLFSISAPSTDVSIPSQHLLLTC